MNIPFISSSTKFTSLLFFFFLLLLACWIPSFAAKEFQRVDWESLDLSERQRNQLQQMDSEWKSYMSTILPRIQSNEKNLRTLMDDPKPDENTVLKLQKEVQDDKARLKMKATKIYLRKRQVLNKDQQEKLLKMLNGAD